MITTTSISYYFLHYENKDLSYYYDPTRATSSPILNFVKLKNKVIDLNVGKNF